MGTNIQPLSWAESANNGGDSRVGGGDRGPALAQDVCSALLSWPRGWDGWATASDVHRDDLIPSMYMPQSPSNASSSIEKQLYLLRSPQGIESKMSYYLQPRYDPMAFDPLNSLNLGNEISHLHTHMHTMNHTN